MKGKEDKRDAGKEDEVASAGKCADPGHKTQLSERVSSTAFLAGVTARNRSLADIF